MTEHSSPAERYAAYARDRKHPATAEFVGFHDFPLDDFQLRACQEI
jgi:ATP-dependent RNA helicase HelY